MSRADCTEYSATSPAPLAAENLFKLTLAVRGETFNLASIASPRPDHPRPVDATHKATRDPPRHGGMDILAGQLFVYHEDRRLVAFRTGPAACRRYIIYVGGMAGSGGTSAPLGAPYIRALSTAANDADWCLVQPMLSSAGPGLGITDGWQYVVQT